MKIELENEFELLALHKVLMEAKYNEKYNNIDVQGSPIVKNLCDKVFNLLIETSSDADAKKWLEWRNLEVHSDRIPNLKNRLEKIHSSRWVPLTNEQRIEYIECLVRPLVANEKTIKELVDYGNRAHDCY